MFQLPTMLQFHSIHPLHVVLSISLIKAVKPLVILVSIIN
jgi:hypothetical protein